MANFQDYLLLNTTGDIHIWKLPNIKGQGRERWIGTRDEAKIAAFLKKHDEAGFGCFFCASTIKPGSPRKKEFALEMPGLHVDTDFKNIDLEPVEIEKRLRDLPLVPSRMHHTGNGIHNLWNFRTPILLNEDTLPRIETVLRKMANFLGSDPLVAHVVALLRCPGSHNSKRGEWKEVRVIREGRERYTLEELEQWMATAGDPVMVSRGAQARPLNAFERAAEAQGFRAPIDVEARLANMVVGGDGDTAVHITQLSCTASLLASGVDEEEAVKIVLEATKELDGTAGWDWVREEKDLRGMCADWFKKHPRAEQRNAAPAVVGLPSNVVSLKDAKEKKPAPDVLKLKKKNEHIVLAKGVQAWLAEHGREIMYADAQCWMYCDGVWKAMSVDQERDWLNRKIEDGCKAIGLISNTRVVNETRAWLQRQSDMAMENVPWDAHGKIPTLSGLVDWRDGSVEVLKPDDYATRLIECNFDYDARCPIWENMLAEDYALDAGTMSFLQECAGAALLVQKPRGLRRALVLLGPSNTGKSNIINVLAGLLSEEVNSTPLPTLENAHGLMPFLKPVPWVLHEAFEQSRWEMSATAKAILSGDDIQVNVKNGPLVGMRFKQPIFWGTNVPPQFREASRAMENRLAIVKMHRAFNPMQVVGTARLALEQGYANPAELVLATEKSGLLNWALAGLKRATERGYFEFTNQMQAALHSMRTDSNMALGFIEACCTYDPDDYVTTADFNGAFRTWWADHRGGQIPSGDALGRAMSSLADPRVLTGQQINKKRIYAGIKLNDEGIDCWNAFSSSRAAEETGMRISANDQEVNRVLTPVQLQKPEFVTMQEAHRTWQPHGQDGA